jgi:hypothetical protein
MAASKSKKPNLSPTAKLAEVKAPPAFSFRPLALYVGIPLVVIWGLAIATNKWSHNIGFAVAGALTLIALWLAWYIWSFVRKQRSMATLIGGAKTKEDRLAAIDTLDRDYKKGDASALLAKAQLQMQEDPNEALETLEKIDLKSVLPEVADQARAQRAFIHLAKGEAQAARALVDPIDLSRHRDLKLKASLGAIISEAWARTGQAKKAKELIALYDPKDAQLADVRPSILRAQVFVYGAMSDLAKAKSAMNQLAKTDPRIIAGFAQRGVHPYLVKEAQKILAKAGVLPKMVVKGPR